MPQHIMYRIFNINAINSVVLTLLIDESQTARIVFMFVALPRETYVLRQ